jgi:hypothetical protein
MNAVLAATVSKHVSVCLVRGLYEWQVWVQVFSTNYILGPLCVLARLASIGRSPLSIVPQLATTQQDKLICFNFVPFLPFLLLLLFIVVFTSYHRIFFPALVLLSFCNPKIRGSNCGRGNRFMFYRNQFWVPSSFLFNIQKGLSFP